MFPNMPDLVKALVFYLVALALAVAVALTPLVSPLTYMLTPLVAVLLVMLVLTRDGYSRKGWAKLGLHRLGLRIWPVALLLPFLVVGTAYTVVWSTGLATFGVPTQVEGTPTDTLFWLLFPLGLLATIAVNLVSNSIGEELGWRGYLLPLLLKLGTIPALLVSGFLHAVWHLPIILLTSIYHADGNRLIVIPLFIVTVSIVGFFLGYMRLAGNSVWPAALAHTAHNVAWGAFGYFTLSESSLAVEYLAGDSGLLLAVSYAVIAVVVIARLRKRVTTQTHSPSADGAASALPVSG